MVINELLKLGIVELKGREFANPQLESRLILAKLLNVDKSYIYTHGEIEVPKEIGYEFLELMKKRGEGYPFQYIFNEKEFMGLTFYIEEGVLIPRPDTEILVEYIIDYINEYYKDKKIYLLDMGIGSGAISLSIASFCSEIKVYGVDIGDIPIKIANINKERFKLTNVEFLQGNLFEPLEALNMEKSFHIIASNPPYIPRKEIDKLQVEIRSYEPRLALDGGIDGLDFYRKISAQAKEFFVNGGLLIYEIGYDQGQAVSEILRKEGYKDIKVLKDLNDLDRVVICNLNCEV